MIQETKEQTELQQENYSEKVNNRLPYETPKLRKHGKVNNATLLINALIPQLDSTFGTGTNPDFGDIAS